MKKSRKLPIQFKIDEADEKKLKQKMEEFGFHTFTSFYSFITKHILEDNVSVRIEPEKKWLKSRQDSESSSEYRT